MHAYVKFLDGSSKYKDKKLIVRCTDLLHFNPVKHRPNIKYKYRTKDKETLIVQILRTAGNYIYSEFQHYALLFIV